MPAAAQRDVEVVADQLRQRDVPAPPEAWRGRWRDRACRSCRESARPASAPARSPSRCRPRNRGTAGRRRRARRARRRPATAPRWRRRRRSGSAKRAIGSARNTFLAQPMTKNASALGEALGQPRPQRVGIELRHDLVVAHDRAGDQVRKQRDEQGDAPPGIAVRIAARHVDQIAGELEGEEADADRQHDGDRRRRQAEQRGNRSGEKSRVLEEDERGEVERPRRPTASPRGRCADRARRRPTWRSSGRAAAAGSGRPTSCRRSARPPAAPIPAAAAAALWHSRRRARRQEQQDETLGMEQHGRLW